MLHLKMILIHINPTTDLLVYNHLFGFLSMKNSLLEKLQFYYHWFVHKANGAVLSKTGGC